MSRLTDNHRRQLYLKDFRGMKTQILEITLIDYEAGTKLMKDYVELARKIDSKDELSADIFSEIEDLRQRVKTHKKEQLDKKDIAVVTIKGKCDYLMSMLNQDTIEQVERRVERTKSNS